jgi:2-keto-4-pentenoate hydratase
LIVDATKLANELIELHRHPRLVAPFSARYPGLTPEAGYAAARKLHADRLAQGWKPVGRKIGFTNRTLWPRYGVFEPMWGFVYDRTLVRASNGAAAVSLTGLLQPRIEPEICFGMRARPPVTRDPQVLLGCIEWVAHSIEIVQCHHADWKVTIADCTADNGLHGCLILGAPVAVERISGLAAALPFLKIDLLKNRERKDQGVGSNVLGSPLLALAFLVQVLSEQKESPPLEAGEIVTTGTLTDAHRVIAGERWSTDLHGFATRNLEVEFR